MEPLALDALQKAARIVYRAMPATPQYSWPLLNERAGTEVWVKHENHTPLGAFKVRGGLVYFEELKRRRPKVKCVVAATRGNHGQSIAFAAQRSGFRAVIVVPKGNSREKNAAMRARRVELVEHGDDFQDALEHAGRLAQEQHYHLVPSFDPLLVLGVASWALELFRSVPDLPALYVPIGLGSGICGAVSAREALGLKTEIIGISAEAAPANAQSFASGQIVATPVAPTIADGMAVRQPNAEAMEFMRRHVARVVTISESEIRSAMRALFTDTHNVAEGAGAAGLAAILREKAALRGRRVAFVLTGGNVDKRSFAEVLSDES
jgi:threonine dehydratase